MRRHAERHIKGVKMAVENHSVLSTEVGTPLSSERRESRSVSEGVSYEALSDSQTRAREDAEVAALDEALVREGVFVLSNERRAELARRLHNASMDPDAVMLMSEFVRETEPDIGNARRYLAGILGSPEQLQGAIARVRAYRERWGNGKPEREQAPGESIRRENMERRDSDQSAEWARMRTARMALAMHRGDRWPLERIAKELERTPEAVQGLIAEAEAAERAGE